MNCLLRTPLLRMCAAVIVCNIPESGVGLRRAVRDGGDDVVSIKMSISL